VSLHSTKALAVADEFYPFIVYLVDGQKVEFAMWRLAEGHDALALFLTEEKATAYRTSVKPDGEWKVYQPQREALKEMLTECFAAGVRYAVLDPNESEARTVFDLKQVIEQFDS